MKNTNTMAASKKEPDEKAEVLKRFMIENFPFTEFRKAGIFTKEMRGDYEAQAARICDMLNYKTVYEYGAEEIRCHISYAGDRPLHINEDGQLRAEPFITVFPSLFD